jgi:flagellar FliJ protein
MKKFEYSLQPILSFKKHTQKLEEENLAVVINKYEYHKKRLNELSKEVTRLIENNNKQTKTGMKARDIIQNNLYMNIIYKKIDEQKNIICELKKEIKFRREKLIEVNKEKKSLENLRGRRYLEYQYLQSIEQNLLIDEQICFKIAKSITEL